MTITTSPNELTTQERRGLASISTDKGHILIVAADQRNSMKAVMQDAPAEGTSAITIEELAAAKADLVTHLANHGPAILLDPEVALPAIPNDGVLARDTALVVGLDSSGFETVDGLKYTKFVPGMSVRAARELGADVIKMLWYTRPDRQGLDDRVADEIRALTKEAAEEGILLIVELLTYQLEGESDEDYKAAFPKLVADGAALAVACGTKLLKIQYPGSSEGAELVNEAAAGVPWAVLSAGVDHETFIVQVRDAMAHGAAGAMAGRSLWKDALSVDPAKREQLLTTKALPRLLELRTAVDGE